MPASIPAAGPVRPARASAAAPSPRRRDRHAAAAAAPGWPASRARPRRHRRLASSRSRAIHRASAGISRASSSRPRALSSSTASPWGASSRGPRCTTGLGSGLLVVIATGQARRQDWRNASGTDAGMAGDPGRGQGKRQAARAFRAEAPVVQRQRGPPMVRGSMRCSKRHRRAGSGRRGQGRSLPSHASTRPSLRADPPGPGRSGAGP